MEKPRVCLLTESFHPVVGGGETQARSLGEGLIAEGHGVLVVTRRSVRHLPRFERVGQIAVHRLPPVGESHWGKWGLLVTSAPALMRMRREYDVIFVSGFRLLGVPAVLVGTLLSKRCILKADSIGEMSGEFFAGGLARLQLTPSSPLFRFFLRLRNAVLHHAHAFVAISQAVAEELVEEGIPLEQIRRIPNCVDEGLFRPVSVHRKAELRRELGIPFKAPVVIFTGRLVSYKGLPLLLQVWRAIQAKHGDARLLVVGEGGQDIHNCEQTLKEYVDAHQLHESVRFTGAVTDVHEYLQAADVFVFPTENEAFGVSLVEAMACGLAVVCTSVGGVKDIVDDDLNGLVVPVADFNGLLNALDRLLEDADARDRLGRAARETVCQRYAVAKVTRQFSQLFGDDRFKEGEPE